MQPYTSKLALTKAPTPTMSQTGEKGNECRIDNKTISCRLIETLFVLPRWCFGIGCICVRGLFVEEGVVLKLACCRDGG